MFKDKISRKAAVAANENIKEKAYWLNMFSGDITSTNFPYDYKRIWEEGKLMMSVKFAMSAETVSKIIKLSGDSDFKLHIILVAQLAALLAQYAGSDDIVIGVPITRQERDDEFVNTALAIRVRLDKEMTFKTLLQQVRQNILEAMENQNYPVEVLADQLLKSSSPNEFSLFDVVILLENIHDKKYIQHINPNLIFSLLRKEAGIEGVVEYNSLLYKVTTVERMIKHFTNVIQKTLSDVNSKILEIEMLGDQEKKCLLIDFNDTETSYPDSKTINTLFAEQVEHVPHHIAVKYGDESLTYRQLDIEVNRLAGYLYGEKKIALDTLVGLLMDKSNYAIISMLGILKAGGAYVPIDPVLPGKRIKCIIDDARLEIMLTTTKYVDTLTGLQTDSPHLLTCLCMDNADLPPEKEKEKTGLIADVQPGNLVYVIYTSGTTGQPKGVMLEHRNLVRLFFNDRCLFDFSNHDVWTMFHSYNFDFSVWEMYGALLFGGELVVIPKELARNTEKYLELLKTQCVTILNQTPSAFYNLAGQELKHPQNQLVLRYVIFGGEALRPAKLKKWKEKYMDMKLINMYGITETTVHVTFKEITYDEIESDTSNIGRPIPTLTSYVMNKNLMLLPPGIAGELCVGGHGLARGYLNNPVLTDEKFVLSVPPVFGSDCCPGEKKIYRSGDLVFQLENGEMVYSGRIDRQVKIRGYRVELGEIENQLINHPLVAEAVVTTYKDEDTGDERLAAYVVPDPGSALLITQLLDLEKKGLTANKPRYELPNGMTMFYFDRNESNRMYNELVIDNYWFKHGIVLDDDACVLDVGAYIGLFSLCVHQLCNRPKVYAFESDQQAFDLLFLNISIHGLKMEVSNRDFSADGSKNISQLIKEKGIEKIDLLKIDMEKSSVDVDILKHIDQQDWQKIDQIVFALDDVGGRIKQVTELLEPHGYEIQVEEKNESTGFRPAIYILSARSAHVKNKKAREKTEARELKIDPALVSPEQLQIDLSKFLKERVPEYMIPSSFMLLAGVPMTANGKINYENLPDPRTTMIVSDKVYKAPTNEVEEKIVQIWGEILKIDPKRIGINDNFFDLGGNSLSILKVKNRLDEVFDFEISLTNLFLYPVLLDLASNIIKRKEDILNKLESLVKLNIGKPDRNLFIIHPLHGMVYQYKEVAKLLEDHFTVYGIQARGLNRKSRLPETGEDLLYDYLYQVLTIQKQGPYYIGAFCLGVTFAYEMARMLEDMNHVVEKVILLDDPGFIPKSYIDFLHRQESAQSSSESQYDGNEVTDRINSMSLEYPLDETLPDDVEERKELVYRNIWDILTEKITLKRFIKSRILLIQAMIREIPKTEYEIEIPLEKVLRFNIDTWRKMTKDDVQLVETPGGHDSMFEDPYVRDLAATIINNTIKN